MPTNYSGNPANITTGTLTRNVAGTASGAGGAVRIETTVAHLYATYDDVLVSGVGGTTEANGVWSISVVDATHFDLVGSTFANAWTSGGTTLDLSLTPYGQFADDGEAATVQSIEAFMQMLADRTQYLQQQRRQRVLETFLFTASGTFNPPPTAIGTITGFAVGWGGGGGGGGGCKGSTADNEYPFGGGGGGGSAMSVVPITFTVGTTYNVTVGAGGAGGAGGGTFPVGGSDGDDSTIDDGVNTVATFKGAGGGWAASPATGTPLSYVFGGAQVPVGNTAIGISNPTVAGFDRNVVSGGGFGGSSTGGTDGAQSPQGQLAGTGGALGAIGSGSKQGGGGGGGGGAGPGVNNGIAASVGGAGGSSTAGTGNIGSTGIIGTANSGAGGGGGGGGGCGVSAGGNGGAGAAGGSGYVMIVVLAP